MKLRYLLIISALVFVVSLVEADYTLRLADSSEKISDQDFNLLKKFSGLVENLYENYKNDSGIFLTKLSKQDFFNLMSYFKLLKQNELLNQDGFIYNTYEDLGKSDYKQFQDFEQLFSLLNNLYYLLVDEKNIKPLIQFAGARVLSEITSNQKLQKEVNNNFNVKGIIRALDRYKPLEFSNLDEHIRERLAQELLAY